MPWTYLLRCSDGSYYAGSTRDLERRVWQHNHQGGAAYTRRRRPVELVWTQWYESIADAYRAEKQIQNWGRAKREALIAGRLDLLPQLARGRRRPPAEFDADESSGSAGHGLDELDRRLDSLDRRLDSLDQRGRQRGRTIQWCGPTPGFSH